LSRIGPTEGLLVKVFHKRTAIRGPLRCPTGRRLRVLRDQRFLQAGIKGITESTIEVTDWR
jgi:hypothetical protein